MPSLDSSPATLTWISTSRAGLASSRRRAESDATEWISRTFGAMSFTLRLWSAPMKSQVNRSRWRSCFASSSWARFSPTSSMPASASAGRSSASTYLIAARISTSEPIRSRTRSRFSLTRCARTDRPAFPVTPSSRRWEKYRSGSQLVQRSSVRDRPHAGLLELRLDHPAQVEHPPV